MNEIIDIINQINFYGLNNIKCGDVLYYPLRSFLSKKSLFSKIKYNIKLLFKLLNSVVKTNYSCKKVIDADKFFLYSDSYGERNDLWNNFNLFTELFNDANIIFPCKSFKISFKRLGAIKLLSVWKKQLIRMKLDRFTKRFIVYQLFLIYVDFFDCLELIVKKDNIKKVVTLCDVHPLDSLIIQYFNIYNVKTMTLQHGVYSSSINSWVFKGSHSKYLLGYGQFTKIEAVKLGIDIKKIINIGSLAMIGKDNIEMPQKFFCKRMGLILDGEDGNGLHELNRKMIEFAQRYCFKRNMKLYIKFHPASDIKNYKKYIVSNTNVEIYSNDISIFEFMKLIDFAIVRNTTCLIDLLQNWVPTFILNEKKQSVNVYENVSFFKFSEENELDNYINNINFKNYKKELRYAKSFFCENGDPSQRLLNFINDND